MNNPSFKLKGLNIFLIFPFKMKKMQFLTFLFGFMQKQHNNEITKNLYSLYVFPYTGA